ncbi:hypothetical protein SAMD00020551_0552 [Mesobacillus selenatarsenatis SF-1]|uniref:Uncharacterized protein n=1 Tax=Mesobacillus selenatarsenatis (strain DSM 18680 / JCM 14380 / FERM P-15431 / SF-1) TaxID=1321606 RepID=A0A0A8WZP5_MESS1|nr:hypothetical protein SAMD00020551_0552 [Mesobacillus selenatarsenatis SF-1]
MKPAAKLKAFIFIGISLLVVSILDVLTMNTLLQGNNYFFIFVIGFVFLIRALFLYRNE